MQNNDNSLRQPDANQQPAESMTFMCHPDRQKYIREQRSYGWEVFLNFIAKDKDNSELYEITRRAL